MYAKKYSLWRIYLNNAYVGSIQHDKYAKNFDYHIEDNSLLTDDQVQKYIGMIQHGELKWRKDDNNSYFLPHVDANNFNFLFLLKQLTQTPFQIESVLLQGIGCDDCSCDQCFSMTNALSSAIFPSSNRQMSQ